MAIYNVRQTVVALVEASTDAEAIVKLRESLTRRGFEPYETGGDAFESEPLDFIPDPLP